MTKPAFFLHFSYFSVALIINFSRNTVAAFGLVPLPSAAVDKRSSSSSRLQAMSSAHQRPPWLLLVTSPLEESTNEPSTNNHLPTHLIVHFDINETILLGDEAGGDSRHDSVQKMLAKSAFVRLEGKDGVDWENTQQYTPTHWWDGQDMSNSQNIPPLYTGWEWPPHTCPFYRTALKPQSQQFTEHYPVYKPVVEACEAALARDDQAETSSSRSSIRDHILPAFWHTLLQWMQSDDDDDDMPTIVFRTFGSDLGQMAEIVTEFAQGKHPHYPTVNCERLVLPPQRLFQGRWKEIVDQDNGHVVKVVYQLWDYPNEQVLVASGDDEILQLLASGPGVFGIRDDYAYWKQKQWDPTAGKPVWVPRYHLNDAVYQHHVLFDDNIHNLPHDGIACVRKQQQDDLFETVPGDILHQEYQGVHLIRVPTVEPVLNVNWFLEQIDHAQAKLQERLHRYNENGGRTIET